MRPVLGWLLGTEMVGKWGRAAVHRAKGRVEDRKAHRRRKSNVSASSRLLV